MQPPMKTKSADDFQTPATALEPLLPYLKKEWFYWDCAEGKGNLVKGLSDRGFKATGTDILTDGDFLNSNAIIETLKEEVDCIITNPPYSKKTEFIKKCYELKKPFALLMPLTILETEKRQALFKQNGIEILLLKKRINFETSIGRGSGSWFATAWFCWKLLPKQLNFEQDIKQVELAEIPPPLESGSSLSVI